MGAHNSDKVLVAIVARGRFIREGFMETVKDEALVINKGIKDRNEEILRIKGTDM